VHIIPLMITASQWQATELLSERNCKQKGNS
jgi:hypothetical protein